MWQWLTGADETPAGCVRAGGQIPRSPGSVAMVEGSTSGGTFAKQHHNHRVVVSIRGSSDVRIAHATT
jgi:hypothetical protein